MLRAWTPTFLGIGLSVALAASAPTDPNAFPRDKVAAQFGSGSGWSAPSAFAAFGFARIKVDDAGSLAIKSGDRFKVVVGAHARDFVIDGAGRVRARRS
jgi:hypothetical protein